MWRRALRPPGAPKRPPPHFHWRPVCIRPHRMFRSRFWNAVTLFAGAGLLMYLIVSLFLPSSRWLIFGVDKSSGQVRLVQQRITFLPPHQFYRLTFEKREGSAQRDGL